MNVVISDRSLVALSDAPSAVRKAFHKQLAFLEGNLLHPSLHAKKYDEAGDLWQARVNRSWRFYFLIQNDTYIITKGIAHPEERLHVRSHQTIGRWRGWNSRHRPQLPPNLRYAEAEECFSFVASKISQLRIREPLAEVSARVFCCYERQRKHSPEPHF